MESPRPANPKNEQRQLAIFDVVRRASGKTLVEVKAMLSEAFAARGVSRQPGAWLDAVASEATYGKPYIVDLPAAIAADSISPSPDPHVEAALHVRRILRSESTTDGQYRPPEADSSTTEGQESGRVINEEEEDGNAGGAARPLRAFENTSPRRLLGILATAVAIALATAAVRVALRWRR